MPKCPICQGEGHHVRSLAANEIRANLMRYYQAEIPEDLCAIAYEVVRCAACALEFSHPMEPGVPAFYNWLARREGYYPASRWEWDALVSRFATSDRESLSLLDVGCGAGAFMSRLSPYSHVRVVGIDTGKVAVEQCRAHGYTAFWSSLEDFSTNQQDCRFDVIVCFHTLEHVPDPKAMIGHMLKVLAPGGKIFVSTPYSPMSFEHVWMDPLNYPPHHLTRWNASAYLALAKCFGLRVRFTMPRVRGAFSRALRAVALSNRGPRIGASWWNTYMLTGICHPAATIAELDYQRRRERVCGQVAADVVLAEFCRDASGERAQ